MKGFPGTTLVIGLGLVWISLALGLTGFEVAFAAAERQLAPGRLPDEVLRVRSFEALAFNGFLVSFLGALVVIFAAFRWGALRSLEKGIVGYVIALLSAALFPFTPELAGVVGRWLYRFTG